MFGILNSFFNKRSVGSSSIFEDAKNVFAQQLTEKVHHTVVDSKQSSFGSAWNELFKTPSPIVVLKPEKANQTFVNNTSSSLPIGHLKDIKDISTAVAVYHPSSAWSLKGRIKTLWNKVISEPLMIFIAPSTVKTTESTALSLYNGLESKLCSFGLSWDEMLKTSTPVVLEPKFLPSNPKLAVAAVNVPTQRSSIFSWLPKFPFVNKKMEEKTFSIRFYNGQEASEQAFCKAWNQTLKKPVVKQNYTASGFYAGPEAFHEGYKKMWNEVVNSTKTSTHPEAFYAKYVLYGLCALTACYFIYKKLNSKEIEQKSHERNDFEKFKNSIKEITTAPITTVPITTVPITTVPITTVPITTVPITTVPITTAPITTAPITTAPITTAPITTAPITTVPITTVPITTAPITTAPITTAPITTAPASGLLEASTKTFEVGIETKKSIFKKIFSFIHSLIHLMRSIFNLEDLFSSKGSKIFLP